MRISHWISVTWSLRSIRNVPIMSRTPQTSRLGILNLWKNSFTLSCLTYLGLIYVLPAFTMGTGALEQPSDHASLSKLFQSYAEELPRGSALPLTAILPVFVHYGFKLSTQSLHTAALMLPSFYTLTPWGPLTPIPIILLDLLTRSFLIHPSWSILLCLYTICLPSVLLFTFVSC